LLKYLMNKSSMGKKENIIAIVQARMGSSRLPNKSMLYLHGHPVIEWIFQRASMAREIDRLVFAIPQTGKDNPLACYLKTLGANLFRGSESDLIERFYEAAKKWQATCVVRISADCPFISGSEIDRLITFFKSGNYDFAYNNVPVNNCYPDGIGAEIMSFTVLEKLHKEAKNQYDREHVSTYIHSHPQTFKIGTFDPEEQILQCPETRIDLDTPEDYEKLMRMDVNINMDAHEIVNAANLIGKKDR